MQKLYNLEKLRKLIPKKIYSIRSMSSVDNLISDAKNIYRFSVRAVQPEKLIQKSINRHSNIIEIQGKKFSLDKNAYIVGFGKAVLGMAIVLESILQDHLVSGILSVPVGIFHENQRDKLMTSSRIKIFEGAQNNIPDNNSLLAANKISELITPLGKSSLLFVLISGGGSALLPSPRSPLTLEEKQKVVRILVSKGATIEELNSIRKKLSLLKGGGLAQLAKPAQVVSLILSDIIGDPIGLIASGPTVENTDSPMLPISIVEKYKVKDILPTSAIKLLEDSSSKSCLNHKNIDFVDNFIIGNNTVALNAAAEKATDLGYSPIIVTNKLCGLARRIGEQIVQLAEACILQEYDKVLAICKELKIEKEKSSIMLEEMKKMKSNMCMCLLFGGETTVEVLGDGTGGRNQELALAGSLELSKRKSNIVLLSAGTDGIDGPTDAAGAIATSFIVEIAKEKGIDAEHFLQDNNSYHFYNSLNSGIWHVKIGHTGTNVMDIIIVLIKT